MSYYDLELAKELVDNEQYNLTKRMSKEIDYHGYDEDDLAHDIFKLLTDADFDQIVYLYNLNNTPADVYKIFYDNIEWYVKFFIDDEDDLSVEIWSLHYW